MASRAWRAGVGGAFVAGIGVRGRRRERDDIVGGPTETAEATESDTTTAGTGDTGDSDGGAASTPPFAFTVDSIEECGQTCRDVTSTLTNQQNSTADDITVDTRFRRESTDGDVVWAGAERRDLEAGGSYTTTRRVELSYSGGVRGPAGGRLDYGPDDRRDGRPDVTLTTSATSPDRAGRSTTNARASERFYAGAHLSPVR